MAIRSMKDGAAQGALALGLLASACILAGCNGSDGGPTTPATPALSGTFSGTATKVGNGQARSFVTLDAAGKPSVIGLKFSASAMDGLPAPAAGAEASFELPLPPQARTTPFQSISLDWAPSGHPPPGIYNVPHFDVHFYTASAQQLDAITPGSNGDSPPPAANLLPAGYISTNDTVLHQGVHYVDSTGPEFNPPQPFSRAFIYGYYKGSLTLMEPMVSRAFLQTKPNITQAIKQPRAFAKRGYYPTRYSVRYDSSAQEYTIALEGLTLR